MPEIEKMNASVAKMLNSNAFVDETINLINGNAIADLVRPLTVEPVMPAISIPEVKHRPAVQ